MDNSPNSGAIYRLSLIHQSQPLVVEVRIVGEGDEVEILSIAGPPITSDDLQHLLLTSLLPRHI